MNKPIRLLPSLLLVFAVLGLAACGFQPRGALPQINGIPGPLYISGVEQWTPLHREISRQLQQAGISVTHDGQQAASQLRIADRQSRRRLLSVDSRNQAAEYELEESFRFSVRSPAAGELVEDQSVRVLRILFRPTDQVLAREREEQHLREDMRRELVARMLRRIDAQN